MTNSAPEIDFALPQRVNYFDVRISPVSTAPPPPPPRLFFSLTAQPDRVITLQSGLQVIAHSLAEIMGTIRCEAICPLKEMAKLDFGNVKSRVGSCRMCRQIAFEWLQSKGCSNRLSDNGEQ